MPGADSENVDHIQRKLNKILETRYDTDRVISFENIERHHFIYFPILGHCRFSERLVNLFR